MVEQKHLEKNILKNIFFIGGANIFSVIFGIIRMKFIAYMFGPSGVALLGLFQQFIISVSVTAALGIPLASTQSIGEANANRETKELSLTVLVLFIWTIFSFLLGVLLLFAFSEFFVNLVFNNLIDLKIFYLLLASTGLAILSNAVISILQGLRLVKDYTKLTIFSGALGTFIGLITILYLDEDGIIFIILSLNVSLFLLGIGFLYKNRNHLSQIFSLNNISQDFRKHLKKITFLGFAIGASTILEQMSFLWVRFYVESIYGLEELGIFQSAFTISTMYLGLIFAALSKDFLPSIAEASSNLKLVNELISKQVELALLLSVPLIILMIGYSPLILELLYTKEFSEAQNLLKVLLFADFIKVVSFPVGFAILGLGDSDAVKRQGPIQLILLVALVYFFLPILGIISYAYIYLFTSLVGLLWGHFYLFKKTGYLIKKESLIYSLIALLAGFSIIFVGKIIGSNFIFIFSGFLFVIFAFYSMKKVRQYLYAD